MVRKKLRTFQARDEMLRIMSERKKKKKEIWIIPVSLLFIQKIQKTVQSVVPNLFLTVTCLT